MPRCAESATNPKSAEPLPLEARFRESCLAIGLSHARVLAAVSGGPDSVALLELLASAADALSLELVVGHVDHGIAVESGRIAALVAGQAERLGLPLVQERLALGQRATETQARVARWRALQGMRERIGADSVVTAHHADDQAETVLMRVLRGTGPAGLAGMAPRERRILRPLLPFRRAELARYLHVLGIASWSDPANEDVRHDRAWIRHQLLPLLQERWPDVAVQLTRVSSEAAQWRRAWDATLRHLPGLDLQQERDGISVAGGALRGYSSDVARAVVRALGLHVGAVISGTSAERVLKLLATGHSGSWVPLGGAWRAAMAFGRLRIERSEVAPAPLAMQSGAGEARWGEWKFRLTHDAAPAEQDRQAMTAWFPLGPMIVRSRRPGDRMQPLGGPGHRTIARLLQEARVPLGRRLSWPVLELDGVPVWIPGVCRSHDAVPNPGTEALRIDAEHS